MTTISMNRAGIDRRPPLSRLTGVELRKMVDTRSGLWVMVGAAIVTLLVSLIATVNHGGRGGTYVHVFHVASQFSAYLLPLVGILLVCGEWTHRTSLSTFTLVPDRSRVIGAKVLAGLLSSMAALGATLALSLLCVAAFNHVPGGPGEIPVVVILQSSLHFCGWMLIGLAFGAALLNTVPAVIGYLVLPAAWGTLASAVHALTGIDNWLYVGTTFPPLTLHTLSATQWAQLTTTAALWIGAPLVIGLRRIRNRDIE